VGFLAQLYAKFKAADLCIYLGSSQEPTNKQIHELLFLPKSVYQKYLHFLGSCIQNSKLHSLVFILASLRNNKQTNPWGIVLTRICLPKYFFQNLGFLSSCIQNSKLHMLVFILTSLRNKKTTKFMGYYSCPKSGLPVYIIYYGICQTKPVPDLGLLNGYLHNFLSKTNEIIV